MFNSAGNQSLEAALYEDWQALKEVAVVANIRPGDKNWLDIVTTFGLQDEKPIFPMQVAVAPGNAWSRQFECFSLEFVRVVPNLDYPELIPPDCSRTRVFHYDQPVTFDMLKPISPLVPDHPCIEQVRIRDKVFIDVRGVHNIETSRWGEKILALLTGAWLITRDNNQLTQGELRYELEISSTIESMAKQGHERTNPPRFYFSIFASHWPVSTSRTYIYKVIPEQRRKEIKERYYRRWRELHEKQSNLSRD